jgi:enamine deaminase RidA (YjgF/YER057c/UK114 family)
MEKTPRRSLLKRLLFSVAGITGIGPLASAKEASAPEKVVYDLTPFQDQPLYAGFTKLGNMVFLSGIGAHFDGDAKAHTTHVLKVMENTLKQAGSSMDKVLKVNVYLHDLNDYKVMNEVYRGLFGHKPPVRTTVATYTGVPNGSWVEIDCIAYV